MNSLTLLLRRLCRERPHVESAVVEGGKVRLVVRSPLSGTRSTVDVPVDGLHAWIGIGTLIQNALPDLSDSERELILTGYTAEDWEDIFADAVHEERLTEVSPRYFVVEASEAGLPPGEWPEALRVVSPEPESRGTIFRKARPIDPDGPELRGYVYEERDGSMRLDVLND